MLKLDLGDAKVWAKCARGYGVSNRTPKAVLGHLCTLKNNLITTVETFYQTHFQTNIQHIYT